MSNFCDECGVRLGYVGEGPLCFECRGREMAFDEGFDHGQKCFKYNIYELKAFYSWSNATNWSRFFTSVDFAKDKAEKHFHKKIKWKKRGAGYTSGDLVYISYDIRKVKIEK